MLQEEMLYDVIDDPCAMEASAPIAGQPATDSLRPRHEPRPCESLDRRLVAIIKALDR